MKKTIPLLIAGAMMTIVSLTPFVSSDEPRLQAQLQLRQSVERKFEEYRNAIRDAQQVDIKNFKEKLSGGKADGKLITNYDLKQLIEGIKWEKEHTLDKMLALELAMDHLENIPDYYTRLERMYWECRDDRIREM